MALSKTKIAAQKTTAAIPGKKKAAVPGKKKAAPDEQLADALAADGASFDALKWALKKFGAEVVYADGERNKKQARAWAQEQYEAEKVDKRAAKAGKGKEKTIEQAHSDMVKTEAKKVTKAGEEFYDKHIKPLALSFMDLHVAFASNDDATRMKVADKVLTLTRDAFKACAVGLEDVEVRAKKKGK